MEFLGAEQRLKLQSLTSAAGSFAAVGRRIAGTGMNVNHLRAADVGTEVTAIAKSLMHGNRLQVWDVMFEAANLQKSTTAKTSDQPDTVLIAVARVSLIVGLPPSQSDKAKSPSLDSKL